MLLQEKLSILSKAPDLLKDLIHQIPDTQLRERRIKGKWSIHEHVCHLDVSQEMIIERFNVFKTQQNPKFETYLPGKNINDDHLIEMNLEQSLHDFGKGRAELLLLLSSFKDEDWSNEGHHPEYTIFNAATFMRHVMMHDHLHMYRIEELWLTTKDFIRKK